MSDRYCRCSDDHDYLEILLQPVLFVGFLLFALVNPLECKSNYNATSNNMKLVQ